MQNGQQIGLNQGKGATGGDKLELFLVNFQAEVLAAFARSTVTKNRHMNRTIANGKAASFPIMGRTTAHYLATGESLDDKRKEIKHSSKTINIDGLLTTDVLIYDIEDAMNHYDVRSEYTKQMGESLAMAADGAVLAEIAKACNLDPAKNENIEGLGSPSVLSIGKKTELTTPEQLGEAVIQYLTQARAKLTQNYVPSSERYFYTTPEIYSAILSALMPNAANYQALIDPEKGTIRNVMGFEIIETPHLTIGGGYDNNTTQTKHVFPETAASAGGANLVGKDNVVGLFHHRSAVATLQLKSLAIERARRPEYQADQIIARYAMGHDYLRPEALGALVYTAEV